TIALLVSSLAAPSVARATTITYANVGSFSGTTFDTGGLTATAQNAGTLSIVQGHGLGVLGGGGGLGAGSDAIDNNESVLFSFDSGAATDGAFGANAAFSNRGWLLLGPRGLRLQRRLLQRRRAADGPGGLRHPRRVARREDVQLP